MPSRDALKRHLIRLLALNALLAGGALIAALVLKDHLPGALRLDLAAAGLTLSLGTGLALAALWLSRPWLAPGAIALGVMLMMVTLMKARNDAAPLYSYRELALSIRPGLGPNCVMASYHHQIQALPFYTGHREVLAGYRGELAPFADSPDAAASFIVTDRQLATLWSSAACVVLIANRHDLAHLQTLLHPLAAIGCEGKKFALSNRVPARADAVADECQQALNSSPTVKN